MTSLNEPESDVVALTGTMGSGKSTAAAAFRALGAEVVRADELAHEAIIPGSPGYHAVISHFGDRILQPTGEVDRKVLGRIVFANPQELKNLEAIVHPRVRELSRQRFIAAANRQPPLVIYECPLFFESGLDKLPFQAVVTVVADDRLCIERIMKRDGLSEADAAKRIAQQLPAAEKVIRSTYILENNSGERELKTAVTKLWAALVD